MRFERAGEKFPVAALSGSFGVAAFLLKGPPFWRCTGTLAIVENLEPFLNFEKLKVAACAPLLTRTRCAFSGT